MVKKIFLSSIFSLFSIVHYFGQAKVFAYVKDVEGNPVERAEIDMIQSHEDLIADKIGYFQFVDIIPGDYQLIISKSGLENKVVTFSVKKGEKKIDLGVISLFPETTPSNMGIVVIDDAMADDDGSSMRPTVGLLNSRRDAFQNISAFELGAYWFRPRGLDNRYEDVLFNGVSMTKNDDGRVDFSNWAGLNDITRHPQEFADNMMPSGYYFGNVGGVVYYNTRASNFPKGASLTYSNTNRSYMNKAMATLSTGLSPKGWSFTLSGSRRWAEETIIEGNYQDSYAYFAAIEKRVNNRFSINLTAFGSSTYRSSNSPNTQEVYDLMGKNYNAYWGWQDGVKRNSRVRKNFEPVFQLQFYNKIGKRSNWNNTFSYQFGSDARSRLDWFHAKDPNPTYYQNLPSYLLDQFHFLTSDGGYNITPEEKNKYSDLQNQWRKDQNINQINWTNLYNINRLNDGVGARYTLVDDVSQDKSFNFVSHFDTQFNDIWKLNINFNYQKFTSDNFRRLKDLLGASYANNLNPFGNDQAYDMDNPNTRVYEGDRTQYSYILNKEQYTLNASTEFETGPWNVIVSVFGAYGESQRDGQFRNHFYLDSSKGKSVVFNSFDGGLKGQITYKIDGRNFLVYRGGAFSISPSLNEIFINPRVNQNFTPNIKNQFILSNELSYILRSQIVKLRVTGYWTEMRNVTEMSRYYIENFQIANSFQARDAFVAEVLSGMNKRHLGIEVGAEIKISPSLNLLTAGSYGDYTVQNNPNLYLDSDVFGLQNFGEAKIKDFKVASTPQKAVSLGFRYSSKKFWWLGVSANYLADNYLDFSPVTRTENFYTNPITGDPYTSYTDPRTGVIIPAANEETISKLTNQVKFENQFMLNANAGKSFLFGKYRMGVSISVNNLLDNRNYITGGFEQARKANYRDAYLESKRETPLFGSKLWYDRGRTFFANVYLRF